MAVTASMVKDLRARTGAGMMECKKALVEADGSIDSAVEALRRKGAASAEKKAGRIAAEGVIVSSTSADGRRAALVEVNCETDFVAKDDSFIAFANAVAASALDHQPADLDALLAAPLAGGESVETARRNLIAKIGENIDVRRVAQLATDAGGAIGVYLHGSRIGVLVEIRSGRADLGRDIAMHVAASRPSYASADQVPADVVDAEREIFVAQARASGKPEAIIEKMVNGRIAKFLAEIALLGQPFVKNPDQSVGDLLQAQQATVARFVRFEVGEGIEKRTDDFVAEVMAQAKGA